MQLLNKEPAICEGSRHASGTLRVTRNTMPFSVASVTPYNPPYQSVFHIWDDYLHLSGCSVFGMSRAEVVVYMAFPIRRYMDVVRGLSNRLRSRDSLVLIHEQQCTMVYELCLAGVDSVSITLARANVESVTQCSQRFGSHTAINTLPMI